MFDERVYEIERLILIVLWFYNMKQWRFKEFWGFEKLGFVVLVGFQPFRHPRGGGGFCFVDGDDDFWPVDLKYLMMLVLAQIFMFRFNGSVDFYMYPSELRWSSILFKMVEDPVNRPVFEVILVQGVCPIQVKHADGERERLEAENVRKEYDEANRKLSKLKSRISRLTKKLAHDFGPEKEFYS
ncbi:hypothetical protein HanLR1_Chr17g0669291 [Helianthus annuus]|nr:hypothetical protein HanHA89_Chr17g0710681 [Helianthus annuus]KAJ0632802.1 hypothetical protein HanLR1_Chr17g0669291 [Helianthus annuus]